MRLPFVGSFPVTQPFGVNPADYAQFGMKGHNGIDYGLPTGTPVVAAINGIAYVLSDPPGFGNYVQVIGTEYKTLYAHLKNATISNGQHVVEGQQIGVSDNTGNSSGPHLHFGVKPIIGLNNNNGFFGAIDPQPILNQGDQTVATTEEILQSALNDARNTIDILQSALNAERKKSETFESALNAEREKVKQLGGNVTELKPGYYLVP
jgi:murein DD-endopeptidase MepM/ murein hydrolase activator NlpD